MWPDEWRRGHQRGAYRLIHLRETSESRMPQLEDGDALETNEVRRSDDCDHVHCDARRDFMRVRCDAAGEHHAGMRRDDADQRASRHSRRFSRPEERVHLPLERATTARIPGAVPPAAGWESAGME